MDNIINFIIEYSNKILYLKSHLKAAKTPFEKGYINSSIENYKSYIDKYTKNSSDYIITCVDKINTLEEKARVEHDPKKKENLEYNLQFYKNKISSRISSSKANVFNKKQITCNSKEASFRTSQKVYPENIELIFRTDEISNMCKEHQEDIKSKKTKNIRKASGFEK